MMARISVPVSRCRLRSVLGLLTSLEPNQALEAALNLGEQGLDADNKIEHNLEVGSDENLDVEEETGEAGDAAVEEVEIALQVDDELEKSLGINLDSANDAG